MVPALPVHREARSSRPARAGRCALKVTVLSGGVGGGRFLRGLVDVVDPAAVTVIGNVGDDLEILSVHVSPDLDSVLYALAGLADDERGWGRAGETWAALETVESLGGESWFSLGDRDLGLHLVRTKMLREGATLAEVTAHFTAALGPPVALIPATNDVVRTMIHTPAGVFPFQTWFVARRHRDEVISLEYAGAETASPAPGVVDALDRADVILITPSNPYVSVHPILAVSDIRAALARRSVPCIAVSPVIAGRAVKGPVDRMLERLAGGTTPAHVAACYAGLIDALVIDSADAGGETAATRFVATDTLMTDRNAARRLAAVAIDAATAAAA